MIADNISAHGVKNIYLDRHSSDSRTFEFLGKKIFNVYWWAQTSAWWSVHVETSLTGLHTQEIYVPLLVASMKLAAKRYDNL